jgi:hypothetical protein
VVAASCLALFLATAATAQPLICMGNPKLKGERTVEHCVRTMGYKFAFVYPNGIIKILSNEDMQLTLAFRPKLANLKSYGIENAGQATKIPPCQGSEIVYSRVAS